MRFSGQKPFRTPIQRHRSNESMDSDSPRETIGGASGGGGTLVSTTKPGTDVGITPDHTHTITITCTNDSHWTDSRVGFNVPPNTL